MDRYKQTSEGVERKSFHKQVLWKFWSVLIQTLGNKLVLLNKTPPESNLLRGKCYRKKTVNSSELLHSWVCFGNATTSDCPLARAEHVSWLQWRALSHLVLWVTPAYFVVTVPNHTVLQTLRWAEPKPQPW